MTDPRPVRLRLFRAKGFNLQSLSRATNGLPAVSVARPGQWGNLWRIGFAACGCRGVGECDHNQFRCETAEEAVEAYRRWTDLFSQPARARMIASLRGNNLACWCALDARCHGDVLIELSNRPIPCEAA